MKATLIVVPPVAPACPEPASPPHAVSSPDVEASAPAAAIPRSRSRRRTPAELVDGFMALPLTDTRGVPADANEPRGTGQAIARQLCTGARKLCADKRVSVA